MASLFPVPSQLHLRLYHLSVRFRQFYYKLCGKFKNLSAFCADKREDGERVSKDSGKEISNTAPYVGLFSIGYSAF